MTFMFIAGFIACFIFLWKYPTIKGFFLKLKKGDKKK